MGFDILRVVHVARASMPGDDLLFHRLSDSTIGAVGFHGRVRNGIGWDTDAIATRQWSRCDMRDCEYLGPSPWRVCRGEGFKIDTVLGYSGILTNPSTARGLAIWRSTWIIRTIA